MTLSSLQCEPNPEPILEPDLPIIDAHHHLWFMPQAVLKALQEDTSLATRLLAPMFVSKSRYLFDEYLADIRSGHRICASVFIESNTMYRASGPDTMKSVGEIEFANGIAAMGASELFGSEQVGAAIVGGIDLRLGDAVEEILLAHLHAGGGRYRGIRSSVMYDEDFSILGAGAEPGVLSDPAFRRGFSRLAPLGLSFDVLVLEPQLPEVIALARDFPQTSIILNHVGGPLGIGRLQGRRHERFEVWKRCIRELSSFPKVYVKLGGLGLPFAGLDSHGRAAEARSTQLAAEWKPYIETCIEAFGARRCMFESNFPVDSTTCSYRVLWNAFKVLTAGASVDEKSALYRGTASQVYRLALPEGLP